MDKEMMQVGQAIGWTDLFFLLQTLNASHAVVFFHNENVTRMKVQ